MRIIWTHIAKNGGHFIKNIAKEEYGSCYLQLKDTTTLTEVNYFLDMPRYFIAVNHHEIRLDTLLSLVKADASRILITRNPIDRFCSFIRHATVLKGHFQTDVGTRLWNQEFYIDYPLNPSNWLSACLERTKMELSCPYETPIISNPSLTYFALSQLWEGFFKMNYIISENKFIYSNNPVDHLRNLRKCAFRNEQSIVEYITYILNKFYFFAGSMSNFNMVMSELYRKNIFSKIYNKSDVKDINSHSNDFSMGIDPNAAASYYGILQEEFMLHALCNANPLFY